MCDRSPRDACTSLSDDLKEYNEHNLMARTMDTKRSKIEDEVLWTIGDIQSGEDEDDDTYAPLSSDDSEESEYEPASEDDEDEDEELCKESLQIEAKVRAEFGDEFVSRYAPAPLDVTFLVSGELWKPEELYNQPWITSSRVQGKTIKTHHPNGYKAITQADVITGVVSELEPLEMWIPKPRWGMPHPTHRFTRTRWFRESSLLGGFGDISWLTQEAYAVVTQSDKKFLARHPFPKNARFVTWLAEEEKFSSVAGEGDYAEVVYLCPGFLC